jgi:hypothetical protein
MTYSKLVIAGYSVAAIGAGAFLWELIARKKNSNIKPSVGVKYVADLSQQLWETVGYYIAKISSFYDLINIEELKVAFQELFLPLFRFCISPLYTAKGYYDTVGTYKYPVMIIAGSLTLIAAILFVGSKYYGQSFLTEFMNKFTAK